MERERRPTFIQTGVHSPDPRIASSATPPLPPPPPSAKTPPPLPAKVALVKPTMKRLNWVKLLPPQIPGSVFEEFPTFTTALQADTNVLQAKFVLRTNTSLSSSTTVASKVTNLLDPKKSQNVGILLTTIKHSFSTIREAIITGDSAILPVSSAISLLKLLPTDDEVLWLVN